MLQNQRPKSDSTLPFCERRVHLSFTPHAHPLPCCQWTLSHRRPPASRGDVHTPPKTNTICIQPRVRRRPLSHHLSCLGAPQRDPGALGCSRAFPERFPRISRAFPGAPDAPDSLGAAQRPRLCPASRPAAGQPSAQPLSRIALAGAIRQPPAGAAPFPGRWDTGRAARTPPRPPTGRPHIHVSAGCHYGYTCSEPERRAHGQIHSSGSVRTTAAPEEGPAAIPARDWARATARERSKGVDGG